MANNVPFSEKKDKTDVNYRNAEKCSTCDFYLNGKCEKVEGNIAGEAICQLWQMRSSSNHDGIHAEFYVQEFNKRGK
jgi:hypothetical protein